MDVVNVLIVGAGPTGLAVALECARHQLSFRIIDQAPAPTTYSKAIVIQARTIEVFQRMGVHQPFLEEGILIRASNIYSGNKKHARLDLRDIPSPFAFALSIEQSKTEHILTQYLKQWGGNIERASHLVSYQERDGVILAQTDKELIQANYLIGCDGAHSTVRKMMGCHFEGKSFADVFSLADVKIIWDRSHQELHVFLESNGILAVVPLPEKDRYRLIMQLKQFRGLLHPSLTPKSGIVDTPNIPQLTLDEIQQVVSSYTKAHANVSDPRWIANFHINSRLSSRYQSNHVFLVGDAAHIHSPVGGQGMNTGIQDAFNLIWKIAYTHRQLLPKSWLNTYETERRSLGKKLLKSTELASKIATLRPPFLWLRNQLLFFLLSFQWIRKKAVTAISEVNIRYRYKRVPNCILLYQGQEIDYFSLTEKSTRFHLLLFKQAISPIDHPMIDVYHVKGGSCTKALLVRPDGYLALEDRPPFRKLQFYFKNL